MGVQLSGLAEPTKITFEQLDGKKIAVDALNSIYQFLSSIRQPDGTPLMDSKGRVTSHLTGLFYRTTNLIEYGIKPIFVFDGKPPQLKGKTISERKQIREAAAEKWKAALAEGDIESAKKHAQASGRVTEEMLSDSKKLLSSLGLPCITAPGEGEAQAAHMNKKGDVYASASQDHDSLLFGAPILIKNLTISGRRKMPGRQEYIEVTPEQIELKTFLSALGITQEQLILVGLLAGNDFEEGVKGIGPKKALELVKKHPTLDSLLNSEHAQKFEGLDFPEVYDIFAKPDVTDDYAIEFGEIRADELRKLLCEEHDFSVERVNKVIERLEKRAKAGTQSKLEKWF